MTTYTTSSRISRRWSSSSHRFHGSHGSGGWRGWVVLAALCAATVTLAAQSIDPSLLLNPTKDSWLSYHGDYSGRRHSALTQITPDNVQQLGLAWVFQTGGRSAIKASPIVVNGVIYITTPDQLWAIDARSGRQIWRYTHPAEHGLSHRSARRRGLRRSRLPHDPRRLSRRARRERRQGAMEGRRLPTGKSGYWSTKAPLLIRTMCSSAWPATSTTCPASCSRSIRRPASCNGPSTARLQPAKVTRRAAALPAGRCG